MRQQYDGFWFPASVRQAILTPDRSFEYLHFKQGVPVPHSDDETVSVRWPVLNLDDWQRVLSILTDSRQQVRRAYRPDRLSQAVLHMQALWADRANPMRQSVLDTLETCTGHSVGMLDLALSLFDLTSIDDLQRAASSQLTLAIKDQFVSIDGLPGKVRFFEEGWASRLATKTLARFASYGRRSWHLQPKPTNLILGHAAGNVPGTGLLLILLGLAAATRGQEPPSPVILVKNSRLEPLFTPLALTALELVDPTLLATTLVTLWDYTDVALQEFLVAQSDLVVAAASDATIADIAKVVKRVSTGRRKGSGASRPIRFHRHGHKVSFSTIGRECLRQDQVEPQSGAPLVDVVALLASLDAALWNQQGCLSSRVHFLEQDQDHRSPEVYGKAVAHSLRVLNKLIPKGISKKRQIHNLFDKYQAIAAADAVGPREPVQVLSEYDDDFLVVLDHRALNAEQFREVVNDCQGRTIVIIPVEDVIEVPKRFLRQIRREHLQSMSVALGNPEEPGIAPRLLRYAEELGAVGVTSIRTVGRGAFPQLAYSWDGLIPLDLTVQRQKGHFTALEFDEPWVQIGETYRLIQRILEGHAEADERRPADERQPAAASRATGIGRLSLPGRE